ncbi:MAG: hypothetical protein H6727_15010 [Myxococcales bacterium]|nr:hypothetical protein [Myxococcales bacterium]
MSMHQRESLGPHMGLAGDDEHARSSGEGGAGASLGGGKEEKSAQDPDEVEGLPLTYYLKVASDLPLDWCIDLFSQLCDAVQSFHENEIFHLSLESDKLQVFQMPKLSGVTDLVTEKKEGKEGEAKDTKAKEVKEEALSPEELGDRTEFAPPAISRYTAPEVLYGEPPSVRSDVYSLAAIFYEVLTKRYFAKPLSFPPEDPRFASYEWEGMKEVLEEALEDDPLDRFETVEEFWEAIEATRRDPSEAPPSALQSARKKIQGEMVGYIRKSVTKEAMKKTAGWMRGGPQGGGGMGGIGHDHTLANEIVMVVIKEIFGMMMKNASIQAKGALDRKRQAASTKRDAWMKRVLRIAGKSIFLVGMLIGMLTAGGTKVLSWFRKPAVTSTKAGATKMVHRKKKKKLPVTLRMWRYFFPKKRNPPISQRQKSLPRKAGAKKKPPTPEKKP